MIKRFARTIEIEVSPEQFVYRYGSQERRVATSGYIRVWPDHALSTTFAEEKETEWHIPVSLFDLPVNMREELVDILSAFLMYGVSPLCARYWMAPIIVFKGMERFKTEFGFEYALFREAGSRVALDEEVHFQ